MNNRPTRDVKTHRIDFIEGAEQLIPESMHCSRENLQETISLLFKVSHDPTPGPNQMIWIDGRQALNKMLP